ncbi:MAG: tetratricopeptide repeat protein [Microcoleaceae cyanobacterium]
MQWNQAAIHFINQGDFKTAISICQQVLTQQPSNIQAYLILGKALQQQGKFQAAIECYIHALTLQPDNSEIYLELGNIYQQQQQWQDAISSYQIAIRLQPDYITAYRRLGQIFVQLQDWDAAVNIYRKLIQLSPQVSWFYHHLGKALIKRKQWKEATYAYLAAIQLNPHFCWSYYHLGQCFIELDQWQNAEKILKKGIEIDSNYHLFYQSLAYILQHQKKDAEAIEMYQAAIQLNPCSSYYINLGKLLIQQQQLKPAIEALINALLFQPNQYPVFVLLGDILKQQGFIFESLQCQCLIKIPNFWIKQYFNIPNHAITDTDSNLKIQRDVIYPESTIQFKPPKTLENNIPAGFNTKLVNLKTVFIATLQNGRIWSDSLTNAVITSNHQIISDLSEGCPELILTSKNLPIPRDIKGTVAFLSVQFGFVYYHWMLDLIPRIILLQQKENYKNIDYFIVNRHQTAYEKETLKMLNIPTDKIIESIQIPHIKASDLIVPSRIQDFAAPQQGAVQSLRQYFLGSYSDNTSESSQVYISRTKAKKRKMLNEEVIIDLLIKYKFKIVDFELMSVTEQAHCMATAKVVIAPHGSGLTNLVFCQPGTKVIEILSPNWFNSCYWILSQTCQLDYFCLAGFDSSESSSEFAQYQDYYVNIQKLQQLMQLAQVI